MLPAQEYCGQKKNPNQPGFKWTLAFPGQTEVSIEWQGVLCTISKYKPVIIKASEVFVCRCAHSLPLTDQTGKMSNVMNVEL